MTEKIAKRFVEQFDSVPLLFRSPGRINILGEHTDYNQGFVLPASIDKFIYVAISRREDDRILLWAEDFSEQYEVRLDEVKPADRQWPNYILGVVNQLQQQGFKLGGFNLLIDGNVPIGAGLSSSAAVECATVFALNELFSLGLGKREMVELAQKAEHTFAGVLCGIMDQFASMFGKKDHVIRLDCLSLAFEYVPFLLPGIKIVLLNTNVKHNLASSEYNTRRQQCEQGVAMIREHFPDVSSLRDVSVPMLDQYVAPTAPLIYRRCKYVVEENHRLLEACKDLEKGDVNALGRKMFRTHEGLRHEYEVSCKELDFLVDFVSTEPGVAGARMMGGGFGGCTINLVREEAIGSLIEKASRVYEENLHLPLTAYTVEIGDGTSQIEKETSKQGEYARL